MKARDRGALGELSLAEEDECVIDNLLSRYSNNGEPQRTRFRSSWPVAHGELNRSGKLARTTRSLFVCMHVCEYV